MIQWGTVAEWVAALGTIAAVVAAVVAGKYAKDTYEREGERDKKQKERDEAQRLRDEAQRERDERGRERDERQQDREDDAAKAARRANAARLVLWRAHEPKNDTKDSTSGFIIANNSNEPMYKLSVTATTTTTNNTATHEFEEIPPGTYFTDFWNGKSWFAKPIADLSKYQPMLSVKNSVCQYEFLDGEGKAWHRDGREPLAEGPLPTMVEH